MRLCSETRRELEATGETSQYYDDDNSSDISLRSDTVPKGPLTLIFEKSELRLQ